MFHLRIKGGRHEIDLIIERDDGRVVAVEVKLAGAVDDPEVNHLRWLVLRLFELRQQPWMLVKGHKSEPGRQVRARCADLQADHG